MREPGVDPVRRAEEEVNDVDSTTMNAVVPGTAVASLCHPLVSLGWQTGSVEPGATATRTGTALSSRSLRSQDVLRLVDRKRVVDVVGGAVGDATHPAFYFATAAADPQPRRLT